MSECYEFDVPAESAGKRLDSFLASTELEQTRSQFKRLIEQGHCRVNGEAVKVSAKLREGDQITVTIPPPEPSEVEPEDIALDVMHQDGDVIVINKPAGLVVHPGPGHSRGTLVSALLAHCGDLSGIGGVTRPGIVHRLDKLTSGVMVAAKNDASHHSLAKQFKEHSINRRYQAVVWGDIKDNDGTIRTAHGRHPTDRKRFSGRFDGPREAVTHFRVLDRLGLCTLVEASLETGRTHQVRMHFAEAGHGVVGDALYGRAPHDAELQKLGRGLERHALHVMHLAFEHPTRGERLSFDAAMPPELTAFLETMRERDSK